MSQSLEDKNTFESDLDRQIANSPKDIPGWGVDADPENDPTYPMKHRNGADYERLNYERPPQQPVTVEVLHSIERPNLTAAFGTTLPPKGVSGALRRYAFKHSESTYMHWVPLVLAEGAGAEMRSTLGTAVFAGMLGVTLFGIFLTPVFFVTVRRVTEWWGRRTAGGRDPDAPAPPAA